MTLILNIDTATENAVVSIAEEEHVLYTLTNKSQKDHASFLQVAVKQVLQQNNISMSRLSAVSVTEGPGSYTGLRVGMASAKGLCYALQIPLITLSTLEVMSLAVINNTLQPQSYFYCPMIDAGRMEVFTALFDEELNSIIPPCAYILQPDFLQDFMQAKQIIFCGNGAKKFLPLSNSTNAIYKTQEDTAPALALLAIKKFRQSFFADLLNVEPAYLKQFYTTAEKRT